MSTEEIRAGKYFKSCVNKGVALLGIKKETNKQKQQQQQQQHCSMAKALFTWRHGAPTNWATRLGGLKHSPPVHATQLSGIVSRLSFERPLSTKNKTVDKRNVLANKLACPLPVTHLLH